MIELNKTFCKVCNELKTRIEDGKYPDGRNKRYVDGNGKKWSGRTCPPCLKKRVKENMRHLRFTRKLNAKT